MEQISTEGIWPSYFVKKTAAWNWFLSLFHFRLVWAPPRRPLSQAGDMPQPFSEIRHRLWMTAAKIFIRIHLAKWLESFLDTHLIRTQLLVNAIVCRDYLSCAAVQSQKEASAYSESKQMPPFAFEGQYTSIVLVVSMLDQRRRHWKG